MTDVDHVHKFRWAYNLADHVLKDRCVCGEERDPFPEDDTD